MPYPRNVNKPGSASAGPTCLGAPLCAAAGPARPAAAHFEETPGYDALWLWFELSRASFLTLPRVMMHDMPDDWQARLAVLLNEWDDHWTNPPDVETMVCLKKHGRFSKPPAWLLNYRHPDRAALDNARSLTPRPT